MKSPPGKKGGNPGGRSPLNGGAFGVFSISHLFKRHVLKGALPCDWGPPTPPPGDPVFLMQPHSPRDIFRMRKKPFSPTPPGNPFCYTQCPFAKNAVLLFFDLPIFGSQKGEC